MDRARERKKSYSDLEAIVVPQSQQRQSFWNEKFVAVPPDVQEKDGGGLEVSPVDTMPPQPPPAYYLVDSKGQAQALYAMPTHASTTGGGGSAARSSMTTTASSDADSIRELAPGGSRLGGKGVGVGGGGGGVGGVGGGYNASLPPRPGGWWSSLGEGKKRILGMRRNTFLAVAAGLCALLVGMLVTVLVVMRLRDSNDAAAAHDAAHSSSGKMPELSTLALLGHADTGALLAASQLAAINWTDAATGTPYSGVVYQSSNATGAALMLAAKDERAQTWTTVNVSRAAGGLDGDVLPGTPLAAATNGGLWNIYYLTRAMGIAEVYSMAPLKDSSGGSNNNSWTKGDFAARLGAPVPTPGSGLAAVWQLCAACDHALFVAWQDGASGDVVYANMTNLTWGDAVSVSNATAPGSFVAVSGFTDTGKSVTTGADRNALRFYYGSGNGLFEMMKGPLGFGKLTSGNFDKPIAKGLSVDPSPKLTSLTYGEAATGWTNNLLAWASPRNGSLTAASWRGAGWTVAAPSLVSSPDGLADAGFSAIAGTQEMKLYAYAPSRGEIHEFVATSEDPLSWTWTGQVDLD